jgi:hypothetical protein
VGENLHGEILVLLALLIGLAIFGALGAWIGLIWSVWDREFGKHITYTGSALGAGAGGLAFILVIWVRFCT